MEYLKRDQVDEAENEAKLALSYRPDLILARIAHAKVLMAKGKFEEAGKEFLEAQRDAEHEKLASVVKTECRLGELQCPIGLRKEESATKLLGALFTEAPGEARLLYEVALPAYEMQDYEKAFKMFDQAVATDPSVTECWKPMAECALALHAFDPAYQAAHNYMDLVGGPSSQLLFARAAIAAKRESEAEEILKQLVQAEPKNARALYLMSRLYKRMGKTEESKKYQADAVKLDAKIETDFPLPEAAGEEQSSPEATTTETAAPKEAPAAPAPAPTPAPTETPAPAAPKEAAPHKENPAPATPKESTTPTKDTPAPTK
jgi:tetratricopeptide (TPR) repeat protein